MRFTVERTSTTADAERPIRERQLAAYYKALEHVEGLNVLEIGCGEGLGASILAEKAASVVAVDYSPHALRLARERHAKDNIRFTMMEVPPLDFGDSAFDVVVCFQMIEHLRDPAQLLTEIVRVLDDSGTALIATVNKDETVSDNPYHLHEFTADEFQTLLQRFFGRVTIYGVFGDELFLQYWGKNRKWVRRFMRADLFGISRLLPVPLAQWLFDLGSRLMRVHLKLRNPNLCRTITHRNFVFRPGSFEGCLDFIALCHKIQKM